MALSFLYEKAFLFWIKRSRLLKFISAISVLFLVFLGSRTGALGESWQAFAIRLMPISIPVVDPPAKHIAVSLNVETTKCGDGKFSAAVSGVTLTGNDLIKLKTHATQDAYLAIIGRDERKFYQIFPKFVVLQEDGKIAGAFVSGKTIQEVKYGFDDTLGTETIIALASKKKFQSLSVSEVMTNMEIVGSKGPNNLNFTKLPKGVSGVPFQFEIVETCL